MAQHIGIVGCSAPCAALCYEIICTEGPAALEKKNSHPEVSMHTHPYSKYLRRVEADDWQGVAELMLSSAEKLAKLGAELGRALQHHPPGLRAGSAPLSAALGCTSPRKWRKRQSTQAFDASECWARGY